MPVFHVKKTTDYTVMSNQHLRDKSLSLKYCRKSSRYRKNGTIPCKGWSISIGSRLTPFVRPSMSWRGPGISCGRGNGTAGDGCGERSTPSMNSRSRRPIYQRWNNLRREIQCWKSLCRQIRRNKIKIEVNKEKSSKDQSITHSFPILSLPLPWRTNGRAAGKEWNGSEKQSSHIAARVIVPVI